MDKRIYLSAPDIGATERRLVEEAFETNWVAPLGPHVDAFEDELCRVVGARAGCALSSGTAGLHLGLRLAGVEPGDEVLCSTFSFVASANPILYLGGRPVFVDSEAESWNLDPNLLADAVARKRRAGRVPRVLMLVHLYGQSAQLGPILEICQREGITLIEDAAESLGATYGDRAVGTFGRCGIFSFNGNKVITTSGGGMLVSDDVALIDRARFLSTQARDRGTYYQHSEVGYNYRLSNVSAAIGRGQLRDLAVKIAARRRIFDHYRRRLSGIPGLAFMPEPSFGRSIRWLTCLTLDPKLCPVPRSAVIRSLEERNIETRPVWRPLHQQPLFAGAEVVGGAVSEWIGQHGLSLPSSSFLTEADLERVVEALVTALGAPIGAMG